MKKNINEYIYMALTIPQYTKLSTNIFYFLTIIFFIVKYALAKAKRENNEWVYTMNNSKSNMLNLFYLFLLIISQIFINNNISRIYCSKIQSLNVFIYTFFPNIIIFGSLIFLLNVFPHWAMPFSNTIGYFIVSFGSKLTKIFKALFKKNNDLKEFIKSNETIVINQMNPDNFDKVLDDLLKFKDEDENEKTQYYNDESVSTAYEYLYKYVYQKHLISHFIWFLLAGTYTITISQGYIYDIQDQCT
jgi:hypothetical protein